MSDVDTRNIITPLLWVVASSLALWVGGCANVAQEQPWIEVGTTTNAELLDRYGEPDLIQKVGDGYIATYRGASVQPSQPRMEIPTFQAGPFGTNTTQMKSIEPGLGRSDTTTRPQQEIRIRYDAEGIVRELMP